MKKTVLFLLVAALCLAGAATVFAADTLPETCPQCGEKATWQPLSEPASNNTLTEGHYYVTQNLSGKAWYTDGTVCLHMNGKTVNGSNRVFYINKGSTLNLMGTGSAIGNAYASGSTATGGVVYVNGGTLNIDGPTVKNKGTAGRMAKYGGVVHVNGGTVELYSGAITGGNATSGGTLYITGGGEVNLRGGTVGGGVTTSNGGGIYVNNGTLNLYEATITGGNSGASGGALYLAENGNVKLYGGTLSGGIAKTNGGNIYVKTGASLTIAGTQITGGECGSNGGGIYVGEKSNVVMTAGTVSGGTAGSAGGCIYQYTDAVFDMSGGTVGNGTCDSGPSFYVRAGGIVNLSGDASAHELRTPSFSEQTFGISGKYTGTLTLKANSYPDGQIVGPATNADLRGANITVGDGSIYLVVKGDALRLSKLGQINYKTLQEGYCQACDKTVEWVLWDADDCKAVTRTVTGHYRVNFTGESCYLGQKTVGGTDLVCIDLNGKTLYADRAFDVNTGVLNLVDTVGGGRITGQGTNTTEASYGGVGYVRQDGEMNIYGGTYAYQMPTDGRHYINRGGIFYVQGEWNLYGGEILGGAALTGSAVFGNSGAAYCSHLGLYGGRITTGTAIPGGSTGLCVMTRGTVTAGGNCSVDELLTEKATGSPKMTDMLCLQNDFSGNICLSLPAFDGCEDVGTAGAAPAGLNLKNDSNARFYCVDGQLLAVSGQETAVLFHQDGTASGYTTVTEAIGSCALTDRLVLMADVTADISIDTLIHMDLNGFDITGNISGKGTLACMDNKTDDFTVADGDYGRIRGEVRCALTAVTAQAPCSSDHYVTVETEEGISFHCIRLEITEAALRPSCAGIYYLSSFCGDEMVSEEIRSLGVILNAAELPTPENMDTTSLYTVLGKSVLNKKGYSCLLSGIMKPENEDSENVTRAATDVYAAAYVTLTDGTVLMGQVRSTNLQKQVSGVDAGWKTLSLAQKQAYVAMYQSFSSAMETEDWTVTNARSIVKWQNTFATTDYTPYLAPWTENVVEKAKADGKIHYYFMAGEGLLISETQTYPDKWGDSTLVVFPNGQTLLIDVGPLAYGPVLAENLRRMGVTRLDALLITHPHSDHHNGAFADAVILNGGILEHMAVDQVYYRGGEDRDTGFASRVPLGCQMLGIPIAVMNKGDVVYFGDVKMECIWPVSGSGDGLIVGGEEINNMSVVVRFDYGEHSSLFTGDIYKTGEKMILEQVDNSLLDVDFLKVPHHGYDTSSSLEFIEAVSPEVAMAIGRLKIPNVVRNRYAAAGVDFLDDRTNGYVHVTGAADGTLEYVCSRTGEAEDVPETDPVVPDEDETEG